MSTYSVSEIIQSKNMTRYEISNIELGGGSFSKVYLGKRIYDGKDVAIKCVNVNFTTPKLKEKILSEIGALKWLSTQKLEYIVKIYDSIVKNNVIYIIFEYMDKGPITNNLPYAVENFYAIFEHLVKGLEFMHSLFMIHRDIKLDNILLNSNGDIKYADFGLSCSTFLIDMTGHIQFCDEGVRGTPQYMDPQITILEENLRMKTLNAKSDIFSLGVVFYKIITNNSRVNFYKKSLLGILMEYNKAITALKNSNIDPIYTEIIIMMLNPFGTNRPTANKIMKILKREEVLVPLNQVGVQNKIASLKAQLPRNINDNLSEENEDENDESIGDIPMVQENKDDMSLTSMLNSISLSPEQAKRQEKELSDELAKMFEGVAIADKIIGSKRTDQEDDIADILDRIRVDENDEDDNRRDTKRQRTTK